MKWKATTLFGQCDLSLEAGGGVRSDIIAGPVKYTNIYETFPWADDTIYMVNMTGQQIWNYLKDHNCDAALSAGWQVTAYDGTPTAITYNGSPVNLTQTYKVAINNYMYLHDPSNFSTIDPNPQTSTYLARTALVDYTGQFTQGNPYQAGPPRYTLNTDFSGGYRVVVTMMNDSDSRESFKDGFVRFLSATPETLAPAARPRFPPIL
jgi:2',3'-cyclic-nucleotide 2'-phosphodiesterase (5'-nucleotidase family)